LSRSVAADRTSIQIPIDERSLHYKAAHHHVASMHAVAISKHSQPVNLLETLLENLLITVPDTLHVRGNLTNFQAYVDVKVRGAILLHFMKQALAWPCC
jgi:hypothetical protein